MHEPGGFTSFGINKEWWSKLSKTEQLILTAVCQQEAQLMMAEANAQNGVYLKKLIDEHGVELREFNDEIYESFGEAAAAVFDETRQHSDLADRIYKSFEESRNSVASWLKLADVDYSIKRNRVLGI
jgi:TRAP-type mannitol/chloroaromatic compound transport system substrate-binding protein